MTGCCPLLPFPAAFFLLDTLLASTRHRILGRRCRRAGQAWSRRHLEPVLCGDVPQRGQQAAWLAQLGTLFSINQASWDRVVEVGQAFPHWHGYARGQAIAMLPGRTPPASRAGGHSREPCPPGMPAVADRLADGRGSRRHSRCRRGLGGRGPAVQAASHSAPSASADGASPPPSVPPYIQPSVSMSITILRSVLLSSKRLYHKKSRTSAKVCDFLIKRIVRCTTKYWNIGPLFLQMLLSALAAVRQNWPKSPTAHRQRLR